MATTKKNTETPFICPVTVKEATVAQDASSEQAVPSEQAKQSNKLPALDSRKNTKPVSGIIRDYKKESGSSTKKKKLSVQFDSPVFEILNAHEFEFNSPIEAVTEEGQEDAEACAKQSTSATKQLLQKWKEMFQEGEEFEDCLSARLDMMLDDAYAAEESLLQEKAAWKKKLENLSKTLGQH